MDYKNYSVEDFVADEGFTQWVKSPGEEEHKFWDNWLLENPEKKTIVAEAREIINLLEFENKSISFDSYNSIKTKVYDRIKEGKNTASVHEVQYDNKSNFWVWGKVAAVVIPLIILGVIWNMQRIEDENRLKSVAVKTEMIEKVSSKGTKNTFILADGTRVKLNSDSKLSFSSNFAGKSREVYLEGEAFFEVTKNPDLPFLVKSKGMEVKVLGTSFNVKAYPEESGSEVAVLSGKVTVDNTVDNKAPVILLPNEMVSNEETSGLTKKNSFDFDKLLGWKDGKLVFDNSNFDEVKTRLERWYGVDIEVEKVIDKKKDYSAKFHNKNLVDVLNGIAYTFDFKYKLEGKVLKIY